MVETIISSRSGRSPGTMKTSSLTVFKNEFKSTTNPSPGVSKMSIPAF